MEDANATILEFEERKNVGYFAVYDGHGGIILFFVHKVKKLQY